MRPIIVAVVVVASGCLRMPGLDVGTQLSEAEVRAARDDVAALVRKEIGAHHTARAFYALELHKTRAYATQRLSALPYPGRPAQPAYADLREVFRSMYTASTGASTRGLVLAAPVVNVVIEQHRRAVDALFWQDFALQRERQKLDVFDISHRYSYATATAEQARLMLAPRQAFGSFFVDGDQVFLFWIASGELSIHRLSASTAALRAATAQLLATLRTPPSERAAGAQWREDAAALYAGLFEPVVATLSAGALDTVYVSPDQFIANVPFDVLLDGDVALIERVQVSRVPSASVLRKLFQRADQPMLRPRLLAVGNPVYPEGVADLPFAAREAELVSDMFEDSIHLAGADATESRVVAAMGETNVLHFATHAVLLGRIVPDASSLLLSPGAGGDGFLSAAEIVGLDLSAVSLVILSACQTSVSDERGGSLDLGSLSGAFLGAGVPTVVGTLWHVADKSTAGLMLEFYRGLLAHGSSGALRRAKLAMWRGGSFRDPFFWAAFVLYGWGR